MTRLHGGRASGQRTGQLDLASVRELIVGIGDGTAGSDGVILVDDVILFKAD